MNARKKMICRNIVMAVAIVAMGLSLSLYIANTGSVPAADKAAAYTDGTYTASAQGCVGEVGVTVTIIGGKVTNVAVDASAETPSLGGAAAETLAATLTEKGTTSGVDAISGSTMTSDAIFAAMDDCLAQAAGGASAGYTDGTYTASAQGCVSEVGVTVTISGGKVTEVAVDASNETPSLGGAAAETLAATLTEKGTTSGVDAISGSTMTSDAIFAAMDDCLAQAAQ